MPWWAWVLIAVGSYGLRLAIRRKGKAVAFKAGLAFSKLLITRLGKRLANHVEDIVDDVVDMLVEFKHGMNSDNGGTDAKVADSSKPTGKSIARGKRSKRAGWGR